MADLKGQDQVRYPGWWSAFTGRTRVKTAVSKK